MKCALILTVRLATEWSETDWARHTLVCKWVVFYSRKENFDSVLMPLCTKIIFVFCMFFELCDTVLLQYVGCEP